MAWKLTGPTWALGLALSLVGCGAEEKTTPEIENECEDQAGDECECDDGSEGEWACDEDDDLTCSCGEPATVKPEPKVDASEQKPRDSGTNKPPLLPPLDAGAAVVDAAKPSPAADAGADAAPLEPVSEEKPDPAKLPKPTAPCPEIKDGTVTFKGSQFRIYVGNDGETKNGPLVFYWYATGSSISEVTRGLSPQIIDEIKSQGGMVAAMVRTTGLGQTTGNFVWYVEDYKLADEVLACAIEKKVGIDTSRIHAIGFSAGGLQSSWMAYARNNYMASVVAYSGGLTGLGEGTWVTPVNETPDPSNTVSAMLIHGAAGRDVVVMDFAAGSAAMAADIKKKGGFAMDCNTNGGHSIPSGIQSSAWQFMKDHPYKVKPSPYVAAGIPSGFPSYCKIP